MGRLTRREREIGKAMREGGLVGPDRFRTAPCLSCGADVYYVNGFWLRWQRKNNRLSLRAFARSVKRSAAYISDIERNQRFCPHEIEQAYDNLEMP